jgi:hypothetical protein
MHSKNVRDACIVNISVNTRFHLPRGETNTEKQKKKSADKIPAEMIQAKGKTVL